MRARRILGIDLGGCGGNNTALVLTEGGRVLESLRIPRGRYERCNETLLYLIKKLAPTHIGIDAPLSIPRKLYDPHFKSFLEGLNEGEITNPYLYRETEYFIYKRFGLRPMPPVGDRIGRITARAAALLPHLKEYRLYELYPKQIKQRYAINFSNDPHIDDAYAAAFGVERILEGKTLLPIKGAFREGWIYPVL
jgi:predicted nuclease with RNAse H fold